MFGSFRLLASGLRPAAVIAILHLTTFCLAQYSMPKFDVQGHRGARGLMPENSIPAFLLALDSGVTTIELDLAVTKDKQLVVSHEPWMSANICLSPAGTAIDPKQERDFKIFQMTYTEVAQWDCGSKGNDRFPEQNKMKTSKPLLKDVIVSVEDHIKSFSRYEVDYNIEIKSDPKGDNSFHPTPEEFSDLLLKMLDEQLPMQRVVIQSFDFRVLRYIQKKYPDVRLAALVENRRSIDDNLNDLGFVPDIYSPAFQLLSTEKVKYLQSKKPTTPRKGQENGKKNGSRKKNGGANGNGNGNKLRVIPWTVNEIKDMEALQKMGVDGIITDFPNRARGLIGPSKAK
jgi:glycerophosphoryl diester phosphodiesterase